MATDNYDYDKWEDIISAYLNKKMTDSDRIQFETDMANIPDLKEAVEFDKALMQQAKERYLFQHLKPHLDSYVKEKFPDSPIQEESIKTAKGKYPLSIKLFLGILSVIAIIITGVITFKNYQKIEYRNEIISKWLTNAPLIYDNTNFENFQVGNDSMAIQAYKEGRYIEAESFFSQNDSKTINEFGPRGLYRAINALMINSSSRDKAIEILKARYENKNTFKYEAVEWYLGLAYLQDKDFESAKKVLKGIAKESEYAAKANEVVTYLEQKKL